MLRRDGESRALVVVDNQSAVSGTVVTEGVQRVASELTLTAGHLQRTRAVHLAITAIEHTRSQTSCTSTNDRTRSEGVGSARKDLEKLLEGAVGTSSVGEGGTSASTTTGDHGSVDVDAEASVHLGDEGQGCSVSNSNGDGDTRNFVNDVVDQVSSHSRVLSHGSICDESGQSAVGCSAAEVTRLTNRIVDQATLGAVGANVSPLDSSSGNVGSDSADVCGVCHDVFSPVRGSLY